MISRFERTAHLTGVYLFTLMGSAGDTAPFDCPADRSRGAVGTCTISDAGEIGTIQKVEGDVGIHKVIYFI